MLALRSQRQVALRLVRFPALVTTHPCECDVPHAESSSAPFRRAFSSSMLREAVPAKRKGKGRMTSATALAAINNARRLAQALKQEGGDLEAPSSSSLSSPESTLSETTTSGYALNPDAPPAKGDLPLASTSPAPTVKDLLAKRPANVAPYFPWHEEYRSLYARIYDSVDSAFTAAQMRKFANDLRLPFDNGEARSKAVVIRKVLYDWGWAVPGEEPIVVTKEQVFDLQPSDLFLLLQHDDAVQRAADDRNVALTVVPAPQGYASAHTTSTTGDERMVLVATGLPKALDEMSDIIKKATKAISRGSMTRDQAEGLSVSPAVMELVSNVAGAYVEPAVKGTYRISATEPEKIGLAKSLLVMASLRCTPMTKTHIHIITPREPNAPNSRSLSEVDDVFTLSPTTASTNEPFPWDLLPSTSGKALFRLRKVWPWAVKPGARGLDQEIDDLASAAVVGVETERSTLWALANRVTSGKPKLTARFGHLLFPVTPSAGTTGLWDAPLPHKWPLETARQWMASDAEGNQPIFAPRLTPAMVHFPLSTPPRTIRRLRYRASSPTIEGDTKVVNITGEFMSAAQPKAWFNRVGEMLDNMEGSGQAKVSQKPRKETDWLAEVLEAERKKLDGERETAEAEDTTLVGDSISALDEVSTTSPANTADQPLQQVASESAIGDAGGKDSKGPQADPVEEAPVEKGTPVVVHAEMEVYNETDIFFPDRPVDFKLIASSVQTLPTEKIPDAVAAVFRTQDAATSSFPPLSVTIEGESYFLDVDEEVRIMEKVIGPVVSRILQVKEVGTRKTLIAYNELELRQDGGDTPQASLFWEQLAKVTRDVGPDASALEKTAWST